MKKLFIALCGALSLMACSTQKNAAIDGEWNIVKVEGAEVKAVPGFDAPFFGINTKENMLYGSTSCNRLTGSLNIDTEKKTIDFGATGSTRMMCPDMTTERAVLGAMAKITGYNVDGDALSFTDANGNTVMELKRK